MTLRGPGRSATLVACGLVAMVTGLLVPVVGSQVVSASTRATAAQAADSPVDQTVDCQQNSHPQEGQAYPDGLFISAGIQVPVHIGESHTVKLSCASVGDTAWTFPKGATALDTPLGQLSVDGTVLTIQPRIDARGGFDVWLEPKNGQVVYKPLSSPNTVKFHVNVTPYRVFGLGDSWTAAFGFYGNGDPMPVTDLLLCKPGSGKLNDRCSSNGYWNGFDGQTAGLAFAKDWGYGNNISWAAQAAHSVIAKTGGEYKNLAVSGAEPVSFLPGGVLTDLTKQTVAADPDITLITLGGNPMLGDVLNTLEQCQDARKKGTGALKDCAAELMRSHYQVQERLTGVYKALLAAPHNHIVIASYADLIVPYYPLNNYTFAEWRVFGTALNDAIAGTVSALRSSLPDAQAARLHLVDPIAVTSGAADDAGNIQCRRNGNVFKTRGQSVLASVVQSDLSLGSSANRFCGLGAEVNDGGTWKPAGTDPWFNSQDLGTHLTRTGNAQIAAAAMSVITSDKILPGAPKGVRVVPIPTPDGLDSAAPPQTDVTTPTTAAPDPTPTTEPPPPPDPPATCAVSIVNRLSVVVEVTAADGGPGDQWDPERPTGARIDPGATLTFSVSDAAPGTCKIDARLKLDVEDGADPELAITAALPGGDGDIVCDPTDLGDEHVNCNPDSTVDGRTLTATFELQPA